MLLKYLPWRRASDPANPHGIKLLGDPDHYRLCLVQHAWRAPKGDTEDMPLYLFELEYFFYGKWPVASIPDSHDSSESRYAVFAAISALLVEFFNQRMDLGLPRKAYPIVSREELEQYQEEEKIFEEVPDWANRDARLKETLVILHEGDELAVKNIHHWQPHIYFV
ncbi:hypothetical protein BJX62DRAFT_230493 [Aspergillus germanicus]